MKRLNGILQAGLLASALPTMAGAEEWYPPSCLGPDICARVETINWITPAGDGPARLVVTAAGETATVRKAFATLDALDRALHVCMQYDAFGDLEVTCLMVPHLGY